MMCHHDLREYEVASEALDDLRTLKTGWLDGRGRVPSAEELDWLAAWFNRTFPAEFKHPRLYPTAEGGVLAEWKVGGYDISLEVDPGSRRGAWHDLHLRHDVAQERHLDLTSDVDLGWLAKRWDEIEEEVRRQEECSRPQPPPPKAPTPSV